MYETTVELLQKTIAEKKQELLIVKEQMQLEIEQRKEVEKQLQQAKETLEELIKQRTLELVQANSQLTQEIQERTLAESEVRRLNAELERRVEERTAQLAASNRELQQEIRERQLLEEKLHISESKIRAVFEAMTDIVLILDRQGNLEVIPTNTSSQLESDINLVNATIARFFQTDDAEGWWVQVYRALETQEIVDFDYCLIEGAREFWFTARISPMSANAAIWAARDISDRKLSESILRQKNEELARTLEELKLTQQELIQSEKMAALGQLIAGVAHEINSPLGAIRSSVQNITDFLAENLKQLPVFFQQLSLERQQDFFALLEQSNQKNDILSSKEKRQLRKVLQQQLEIQGIESADSLACTLIDIGICSDVEPFLPLLKSADSDRILQAAYQLATVTKSANTITTATERAAKIVFALKNYARYDHSGERVQTQITDGIETVLTLYHHQIKQGIEVIRNYAPQLPLVLCYPDELNQVWTNLIHNALQAMEYRGTIKIDVRQQEHHILISITDSGKGIPDEVKARIFEPFFTTKPLGEGSGLGLDIVRKIIEKHQGAIEVISVPGETTFKVLLPLQ